MSDMQFFHNTVVDLNDVESKSKDAGAIPGDELAHHFEVVHRSWDDIFGGSNADPVKYRAAEIEEGEDSALTDPLDPSGTLIRYQHIAGQIDLSQVDLRPVVNNIVNWYMLNEAGSLTAAVCIDPEEKDSSLQQTKTAYDSTHLDASGFAIGDFMVGASVWAGTLLPALSNDGGIADQFYEDMVEALGSRGMLKATDASGASLISSQMRDGLDNTDNTGDAVESVSLSITYKVQINIHTENQDEFLSSIINNKKFPYENGNTTDDTSDAGYGEMRFRVEYHATDLTASADGQSDGNEQD
jgi:hypothetical protein